MEKVLLPLGRSDSAFSLLILIYYVDEKLCGPVQLASPKPADQDLHSFKNRILFVLYLMMHQPLRSLASDSIRLTMIWVKNRKYYLETVVSSVLLRLNMVSQ